MNTTMLLAALLSPEAHAFCGTFIGGDAGSTILNNRSQIVIARSGETTTLTLANDYDGPLSDFAMVVPVPEVLGPDDVRTVIPELIGGVDGYSQPRLVEYSCEDFYEPARPRAVGCMSKDGSREAADSGAVNFDDSGGVDIEAEFEAGEYSLVVLSAEQSSGLLGWLNDNGYAVSLEAEEALQEYIDSGSYFIAAKVSFDNLPADQDYLSPLQLTYADEGFSLPIRLGTVNSPGEQELIVYALTDFGSGQVHIANYDQFTFEDECMVDLGDQAFGDWWSDEVDAMGGDEAGWVLEYGWAPYHCDPCADGEALDDWTVNNLGYDGTAWDAYFTRLRMRYTPAQATEDLALYESGIAENTQVRYILHKEELEATFEVCGEGMVDDPGTCDDQWRELRREDRRDARGCASGSSLPYPVGLLLTGLLAAGAVIGRRRR